MAKVLIVSDSHGKTGTLKAIIAREQPFDLLIHCGDSELDDEIEVLTYMADVPVYAVKGNCDIFSALNSFESFDYQGHRILVVHGHREGVNYGLDELYRKASGIGADVVFFGHTHVPHLRNENGITMANPGSTDRPRQSDRESTYMTMEIKPGLEPEIMLEKYSF